MRENVQVNQRLPLWSGRRWPGVRLGCTGIAESGAPAQARAAAEGTTVAAVILAALTRYTGKRTGTSRTGH
jgi:hypothetical protein